MQRTLAFAALGLWMALAGPGLSGSGTSGSAMAGESQKTPEAIEQQYAREKSAKKRADIAKELLNARLEQLRSLVKSGTMLNRSTAEVTRYISAADLLASAVSAANHPGTSKQCEMFLRSQLRDLEELRMDVSVAERKFLDVAIKDVSKLQGQILYSIMLPRQDSARQ